MQSILKLKKLVSNGKYAIYEINNIMLDVFSMPYLEKEEGILDGNVFECCNQYLDYISKKNIITIIKGRHNNYYTTVLNKKNFNIIELDGDIILSYDTDKYEKDEIIDMYYERENLFNNTNKKRRVRRSLGDISLYTTPTGTISLLDVRNELGMGGQIDMNNANVRKLAGRPSGQIAMSDLRGKSAQTVYRFYITSETGNGSTDNNSFGCQHISGYNRFGSFEPSHLGTPNLYIGAFFAVYLKGALMAVSMCLDTTFPARDILTYSKYTNHVDVNINGTVFKLTYQRLPNGNESTTYCPTGADNDRLGNHLRALLNQTVNVTFNWYN